MATVILVRHGRSTANTDGVLAGRRPGVRLDDVGRQQAAALAERLSSLPLAAVVTSPQERCRQTAKAVVSRQPGSAGGSSAGMVKEQGIAEVEYGAWAGRSLKELAKQPLWKVVQAQPSAAQFPDGESMAAMSARSVAAVRRWDRQVEEKHGADSVWAAVSHGDVIKAVLADALGMHLDAFQRLVVDPGSVSVIRYTTFRPFVLMTNSTAGELGFLAPPKAGRRRRSSKRVGEAAVGGGLGTRRG